jgi:hypothetical protein
MQNVVRWALSHISSKGVLPRDERDVLLVGHPEVGHHHAALVPAEAAVGAPRAL